ncbi:MFS transporter [Sutterella sp.]|uniref:MFS transporter n=1 Tax=Sutterella sp. TaxID=1981025 RepID=UPI0026DF4596|nr:MFS transporter [Sutterella sp.]MDO5530751.1 MFS transporter [Sutterella sp.]
MSNTSQSVSDRAVTPVTLSLFAGVTALIASEFTPVSLLTPIAGALGISTGTAGQTVTAVGAAAFLTSLLIAPLFPRTDRRLLMLAFTLIAAVSNALIAVTESVALHFAARAALGLSVGGFWSLSVAYVQSVVSRKALAGAFSVVYAGVSVATLVALPGAAALSDAFGWRAIFAAVAALTFITFLWQWRTLPEVRPAQTAGLAAFREVLAEPAARFGLLATFTAYAGYHTVFTYVRAVLETSAGLTGSALSTTLLVYAVINVIGTFVAGRLFASAFRAAFAGTAVAALAAPLLMLLLEGSVAIVGPVFLAAFVFGFIPVGWSVWLVRTLPHRTEIFGGLSVAVTQLSIGAAANAGGLLFDSTGTTSLFILSAVLCAGTLALLPGTMRPAKAPAGPHEIPVTAA